MSYGLDLIWLTKCQPARKVPFLIFWWVWVDIVPASPQGALHLLIFLPHFFRWVRVNMTSVVDIVLFKVLQRQRLSGGQLVHIRFDISLPMSFRHWVSLRTFLKGLWIGWFGLIFNDTLQKSENFIYFDILYIVAATTFGVSLLTIFL